MSTIIYKMKAGTTSRPLDLSLTETDGSASSLLGFIEHTLHVWWADGTESEFEMSVLDPSEGTLRYQWLAGETDIVGVHRCEVESLDSLDRTTIWPGDGFFYFEFTERAPRDSSTSIEWSDVIAMAPELDGNVADAAQQLLMVLAMNELNVTAWGGEEEPALKMARVCLAAHYATLARQGSGGALAGPVTAQSVGEISRTYGQGSTVVGGDSAFDRTPYGVIYRQLAASTLYRGPVVL